MNPRQSEPFLSSFQRLSATGSFYWPVAGDEISGSQELYRIFEFEPSVPLTLERMGSRVYPEDLAVMNDLIEHARNGGGDFEYDLRLRMPDQSVKHLHVFAHGIRDRTHQWEYVGVIQDVTQRRALEEALVKVRSELIHVARVTTLGALTASIAHEVSQPISGVLNNANACLRMLAADPPNLEGAQAAARRALRDGQRASDVITRFAGAIQRAKRGERTGGPQ